MVPTQQEKDEATLQTASVDAIMKDAVHGAPVHVVDPGASPTETHTEMEKGIPVDMLPDFRNLRKSHLLTELGTSDANEIANALGESLNKPTPAREPLRRQRSHSSKPLPPIASPRLPDWFRIGWTAFSNKPNPGGVLPRLAFQKKHDPIAKTLNGVLLFLGWEECHYHVVILAVGLSTWLLSRAGAGLLTFLAICLVLATYFQTSSLRFRRHARDDIHREFASIRLLSRPETVEWLNSFLQNFWLMFEPVLSAYVMENIETYIVDYIPSFLESLQLTAFTLGNRSFRVDNVKILHNTDPDTVCMDWDVSFKPDDASQMTKKCLENRVLPKVALTIRISPFAKIPVPPVKIPVLIENMKFTGQLRIKFKLISRFPYVKEVEACFLKTPMFTYVLKPVGGDTFGFDVNTIPGLQSFVRERVHFVLRPMMYHPNTFSFDVEKFFSGELDITQANGVLAVTFHSCSLPRRSSKSSKDIRNPFVRFFFDHAQVLGQTSVRQNTYEPQWNETHFLLLNNLSSALTLDLRSKNTSTRDVQLARALFDLKELEEADNTELRDLELVMQKHHKPVTKLHVDMRYLPVAKPTELPDGSIEPAAESNSGVLRFTIHECRNLGSSTRSPQAIVYINGAEKLRTPQYRRNPNPKFEKAGEIVVLDQSKVHLRVEIKDHTTFLGEWTCYLLDILNQQERDDFWWDIKMAQKGFRGRLRLSVQWKPVIMTGLIKSMSTVKQYRPPIGVIRLSLWAARKLRNVEALSGSRSDPYARVLVDSQVRARTEVIDNNLNPEWGQTLYVPIHTPQERWVVEVMDWNAISKDVSLGFMVLQGKDLIRVDPDSQEHPKCYVPSDSIRQKWALLYSRDGKHDQGKLHYSAEFYPTMALPEPPESNSDGDIEEDLQVRDTKSDTPEMVPETNSLSLHDLHGAPVRYTPDGFVDLAAYNSGVLTIHIHELELPHKTNAYCQVLVDSFMPLFKTVKTEGYTLAFDATTDAFIKEADFSRVAIEVKAADTDEKSEAKICFWADSVIDIVRRIQHKKHSPSAPGDAGGAGEWFNLLGLDSGKGRIRLSFAFVPLVNFTLPPEESYENQGTLTVTLQRAEGLKAADRSGTSDPFVVFTINGKSYESSYIRKTLNPVWAHDDESAKFTVEIVSRKSASFRLEVFDWNKISSREALGVGGLSLMHSAIESFSARDFKIPLDGVEGARGSVSIRLLWTPQLLLRKKSHTTSLLSSTKRALTSVTGHTFTSVTHTGTAIRSKASASSLGSSTGSSMATRFRDTLSQHSRHSSSENALSQAGSTEVPATATATITITIVEARQLRGVDESGTSDPYVKVFRNRKMVHKTKKVKKTLNPSWNNECLVLNNVKLSEMLLFEVKDYNRFSKSVPLGKFQLELQSCKLSTHQWFSLLPPGSGELYLEIEFDQ